MVSVIFAYIILLIKIQTTHHQMTGYREPLGNHTTRTPHCHKNFSHKTKSSGTFSSPHFPDDYPDDVECTYFFQASPTGRVRISFDYFDMEKPSDKGCKFDFIEIYDIDNDGFKTLLDRHCGIQTPPEFVSLQPKLEIVFKSDFTKRSNGFLAHYYFLGDNWQPFGPSTVGCGPGYLTGIGGSFTSPLYPDDVPTMTKCTWIIKAMDNQKILLTFTDLQIYSSSTTSCDKSFLAVYNGFAIPGMYPEDTYCGELDDLVPRRKYFLSTTSRLVVRFETPFVESKQSRGFHIVWTAVDLVHNNCDGFLCPGEDDTCTGDKCELQPVKFCIDKSLQCNDMPNCGSNDSADERGCIHRILWILLYSGVPTLVFIVTVISIGLCYRRHKRKQLHSIKTEAQMAQQTHWVSPHIRSLESSPTQNRTTIHTTSFVSDKRITDTDLQEQKRVTIVDHKTNNINRTRESPNINDISNSKTINNDVKHKVTPCDDRKEVTHVHLEPINNIPPSFKTHQKRSSYHLMQELNLDDNDTNSSKV